MLEHSRRLISFYRDELGLKGSVPLHSPAFRGNEWAYVKDCLDTGWVSSVGGYVTRFERAVAERCGTRHGVAVVNGTSALHAALHALGVRPGDLVICPTLTFVAPANAIAYCGASPLLGDVEPATLGLDPERLAKFLEADCRVRNGAPHFQGRRIAACIAVHIFGHPVELELLSSVCARFHVPIIEDASEALGSLYKGRPCGGFGRVGAVSFNGNKIVTTGGGGALVTDDDVLADRLRHLTTTARVKHRWEFVHDEVGFNYRLPNLNAALGCAQLEQLDRLIEAKRRLAAGYAARLRDLGGARLLEEPGASRSIYWLNALLFENPENRDLFLDELRRGDVEARPCWRLMHELPAFREAPRMGDLSVAESIAGRLVNIPSSAWMMDDAGAAPHEAAATGRDEPGLRPAGGNREELAGNSRSWAGFAAASHGEP